MAYTKGFIAFVILFLGLFVGANFVIAQVNQNEINELKNKIGDRTSKIRLLEKEIVKYEVELEDVGKEKTSLQGAIKTLELSQGKLQTEMDITENRISATTFQISKLVLDITDKQYRINLHIDTLAQSLRTIYQIDDNTFLETILASNDISEYWEQIEDIQRFQSTLRTSLDELKVLRSELEDNKSEREQRREDLLTYNQDVTEQERSVQIAKYEKNSLLTQTRSKESNYIDLIEEKKAAQIKFERELLDFESQLQIAIDPSKIPKPRNGILSYPVSAKPYVTQYFGETEFSKNNTALYNGKGHNAVDLRAGVGTRLKAALSGTITGTGNTDAIKGCYSYGKWVLIRHSNGLSTFYAHLSEISVSKGAIVTTGQTIGYSGNSGYTTAPHLHFSVYATQGVKVVRYGDVKAITNCADAHFPVAPHAAYLDPLLYLDTI